MWHGVYLGKTADSLAPTLQLQQQFMLAFAAAGAPHAMAMFSVAGYSDETAMHEVTVYFSPEAAAFAKLVPGAAPCERPPRKGLGLLVGDQRCWSILFPEGGK